VTVLARLRAGDESMFAQVLDAWSDGMLRLARAYVSTDTSAEDVVQDTWLAVIKGLDRFAGRSSLKTWVYRMLVNNAKNRGVRESRTIPLASLSLAPEEAGPTVDPSRFQGRGDRNPGHWREPPPMWPSTESLLEAAEARHCPGRGRQAAVPAGTRAPIRHASDGAHGAAWLLA
jgi:RNA polymerase sigma-70 factor, ECF subfamily